MTQSGKLRFDFWQVTMCVVMNLAGKVLDDEWCVDMNGWLCQRLQLNLKAFNKCEAAVCAALNYNLSLSRSKLSAFVDEVQTIHERSVKYIVIDHNSGLGPSAKRLMIEQGNRLNQERLWWVATE